MTNEHSLLKASDEGTAKQSRGGTGGLEPHQSWGVLIHTRPLQHRQGKPQTKLPHFPSPILKTASDQGGSKAWGERLQTWGESAIPPPHRVKKERLLSRGGSL